MDFSTTLGTIVKRRRLTMAEFSEILDSVAAKRKNKTECPDAPLVEKKARQEGGGEMQVVTKTFVRKPADINFRKPSGSYAPPHRR